MNKYFSNCWNYFLMYLLNDTESNTENNIEIVELDTNNISKNSNTNKTESNTFLHHKNKQNQEIDYELV